MLFTIEALQHNEETTFLSPVCPFFFLGWNIEGFVNYSRNKDPKLWRLFTNHIHIKRYTRPWYIVTSAVEEGKNCMGDDRGEEKRDI